MTLGERLMEKLEFKTVFSIHIPEFTFTIAGHTVNTGVTIPVTETVVVMWVIMAFLIIGSVLLTRNLKTVPSGIQSVLEAGIEFLNNMAKNQFGRYAPFMSCYIGSIFLFLLVANMISVISPIGLAPFATASRNMEPLFSLKPPTRDINVTASLAVISILLVLFLGIHARGLKGWIKNLFHPVPFMVIFNLMDFVTRPLALCLRLFGNIFGGFVLMELIIICVPIIVPVPLSLYFDLFDGGIQAFIFCFLTTLYIHEAIATE
ncbi:MAG: F0F1 ATP synthase subunit A [Termitinemataceae bacterium]|nr:MAG: F0F1 ATP synthase subunit A [Termitinemataceae bacterium]